MINLGLIGCGALGETHAQCIAQIPEARFVAYVDTVEAAADAALKQFGGDYATTDVETLLCTTAWMPCICTRHDSRASPAIAAARAGKHIRSRSRSRSEWRSAGGGSREARRVTRSGVQGPFYPLVQMAHEFIPSRR